jgi:hypothetical protein
MPPPETLVRGVNLAQAKEAVDGFIRRLKPLLATSNEETEWRSVLQSVTEDADRRGMLTGHIISILAYDRVMILIFILPTIHIEIDQ